MATEKVWVRKVNSSDLKPIEGLQGRWWRYVKPEEVNGAMIFGMGYLEPGEVAGWHEHPEPEIFFVLKGQGEARWLEDENERSAPLSEGTAFYKVGHISHQMLNTGSEPLIGVYFKVAMS